MRSKALIQAATAFRPLIETDVTLHPGAEAELEDIGSAIRVTGAGGVAVMAGVGLTGACLLWLLGNSGEDGSEELEGIANPVELKAALTFGGVLAVVLLAVHYLKMWIETSGVFAAATLLYMTDVDALTISVSNLFGDDLSGANGTIAVGGRSFRSARGSCVCCGDFCGAVSLWFFCWGRVIAW